MIEDSNDLLQQLFSEAAKQEIEDGGFTERVMQRVPLRINWFTRLWTACCIVTALVLFTLFHGWELLAVQLEVLMRTLPTESVDTSLTMLVTLLLGVLAVGASEVISSGTVRR